VAESCEASRDQLYPFYVLNRAHPSDGSDLPQVGFDAALGDDELEQHTSWDPQKRTFRG
jgi:phage gp29-like protein